MKRWKNSSTKSSETSASPVAAALQSCSREEVFAARSFRGEKRFLRHSSPSLKRT